MDSIRTCTAMITPLSFPLMRGIRVHALFFATLFFQIINTALRHSHQGAGYWVYILLLEGPVMLFNLVFIYKCQQWLWERWQQQHSSSSDSDSTTIGAVLWSYGR